MNYREMLGGSTLTKGADMKLEQEHKDFMAIQKQFFGDVFTLYMKPLRVVILFVGVLTELLRQVLICVFMDSAEFAKLQDLKLREEEDALFEKQDIIDAEEEQEQELK